MTLPPPPPQMPAPLMIIGASGRVGRLLAPALGKLGGPVVWSQRSGATGLIWAPLDGPDAFDDWVRAHGVPGAMLVLAGTTPTTGTDMALNIALAGACVTAARGVGVGRILLASSSAVYGGGRDEPWREGEAVDPPSAYGQAKLAMERACAGTDVCALRIGNVAGADALLTNPARPLVIDRFADGTGPVRSYLGPQTMARVVQALAVYPGDLPPVLNLATPVPVAMADLARAAELPADWRPAPPSATARLVLETRLLETLVPFDDTESAPETLVQQWRACSREKRQDP